VDAYAITIHSTATRSSESSNKYHSSDKSIQTTRRNKQGKVSKLCGETRSAIFML